MVNLVIAAALIGITSYTDITAMKIYNKHVGIFFLLGLISAVWLGNYHLLGSAALVFAIYLFFYTGGRVMSNLAVSLGLMPLPDGASPMGGGDVKLAVTLALLLGHYPVLYGTIAGALLLVLWQGVKQWQVCGSPKGIADVALGRIHAPAAFGPFLGTCSLLAAAITTM